MLPTAFRPLSLVTLLACVSGCDSSEDKTANAERPAPAPVAPPPQAPAPDPKWYEGGTLHKANGLEWRGATSENKLATAADLLATLWQKGALADNVAGKIHTVDDLKDPARELVAGLDKAFDMDPADPKLKATLEAQDVASTSVILLTMMGWIKE